jgi:hypothetical protein
MNARRPLGAGGRASSEVRLVNAVATLDREPSDLELRGSVRLARAELGAEIGRTVSVENDGRRRNERLVDFT